VIKVDVFKMNGAINRAKNSGTWGGEKQSSGYVE
jgi:hypothetical protein